MLVPWLRMQKIPVSVSMAVEGIFQEDNLQVVDMKMVDKLRQRQGEEGMKGEEDKKMVDREMMQVGMRVVDVDVDVDVDREGKMFEAAVGMKVMGMIQ